MRYTPMRLTNGGAVADLSRPELQKIDFTLGAGSSQDHR
jgi:hypothetical protein